jgi:heme oxygenase
MLAGRLPLRALKDQTQDLHERAEQYVRILDRDATVEDYARYLVAMLGFHAPIEQRFAGDAALEAAGFEAASRRKTHLLTRDLLRVSPCAEATLRCGALPLTRTLPRQLGVAYVIEGSTLGGKFILARLPPALAPLRGTATGFLEGYGAATGDRWRSFGSVVERTITTEDEIADAVAGARDTFGRMIDWLARFEQADPARVAEAS